MPVLIPESLPERAKLESENIFVMTDCLANRQEIHPLKILILNLMPTKAVTANQLMRKLSASPHYVKVELMKPESYKSRHADDKYLESLYTTFSQIKDRRFDGMIITGTPIAFVQYEDVTYWNELCSIMEWAKTHVHSTFYICWGALAGLYYHYGIDPKVVYDNKLSGVFENNVMNKSSLLLKGFDDVFRAPHSREVGIDAQLVNQIPELEVIADCKEGGPTIMKSRDSKQVFELCHLEYDPDTLKYEYERDLSKGMNPKIPMNYFPDDDPTKQPVFCWKTAGDLLFSNWLNYCVCQTEPQSGGQPINGK